MFSKLFVSIGILAVLLIAFSPGCAGKEQVYENIYHSFQSMERIKNPERTYPLEEKPMDYQQYKDEREKLLKEK